MSFSFNPITGNLDKVNPPVDISGKQDTLVSGTNIKTINGGSVLGSGDITISGGGAFDTDTIVTTENLSALEKLVQIGVNLNDLTTIVTNSNGDIITSGA